MKTLKMTQYYVQHILNLGYIMLMKTNVNTKDTVGVLQLALKHNQNVKNAIVIAKRKN